MHSLSSCNCRQVTSRRNWCDSCRKAYQREHRNPVRQAWNNAKRRCFNPATECFPEYGGRGITMCREWVASFEAFRDHMGPRPDGALLDRINNSGNYEPGNCRWVTAKDSAANRRRPRPKERCKRGHEFSTENTSIRPGDGARLCNTCQALKRKRGLERYYARKNAA